MEETALVAVLHPGETSPVDLELRALEREVSSGDATSRERLASMLVRFGKRVDACRALGIRWEVDPEKLLDLAWNEHRLSTTEVEDMVQSDVEALDPVRLAHHFPKRQDGDFRGNTTRFLARYRAHARRAPSRRLVLLAWTPGTSSLYQRPEDRGTNVLTIALALRSTFSRKTLLPASSWHS
jgi:hypothetical protein